MKDPEFELKTSVNTRLSATMKDYRVVETARIDELYPFVELGDILAVAWNTKNGPGYDCILTIHIWVEAASSREISDIKNEIKTNIGFTNDAVTNHISLTSFHVIHCRLESEFSRKEFTPEKKILKHAVIDVRYLLQEKI